MYYVRFGKRKWGGCSEVLYFKIWKSRVDEPHFVRMRRDRDQDPLLGYAEQGRFSTWWTTY